MGAVGVGKSRNVPVTVLFAKTSSGAATLGTITTLFGWITIAASMAAPIVSEPPAGCDCAVR